MRAWGGVSWFFAYLGNFRVAWTNVDPPVFSFVPLWSLQVEEQFYLIYPAVVLLLSRLRLRQLLIVCVIASPLLRCFLLFFFPASDLARWVLMPCRMDSLAIGGLVALFMRSPLVQVVTAAQVRIGALAAGTVVLVGLIVLPETNPIMSSVGYTAIDTVCALVLTMVLLRPSGVPARWLRWRPLVYTGQISYGLYMLHSPSSWLARSLLGRLTGHEIQGHSGFSVLITFAAAFVVAGVSWRCFELPILALKDRFARYAAPTVFCPAENKSTRAPRSLSYPWNPAYSPAVPEAAKGRPAL